MTRPVAAVPPPVDPALRAALDAELDAAIALRHALHRDPRLSGDEADSRDLVLEAVGDLVDVGAAGASVAGTGTMLRLGPPAGAGVPAVAVRAELDALPVVERTGLPFSATGGAAHVCGHDVHVAALVAVVRALARGGADRVPAPLLAVFQPREEKAPSGAADVAADPGFVAHRVGAVLGVHVQPELPRGTVSVRGGPVNASADEIEIEVHGRGGHGGYPHRTRDPVLALAQVVASVHHIVSRRVDPMAAGVITIGQMEAGSAPNVVPETATARGTVRALDADRDELLAAVRDVVEGTARAHGCEATLTVVPNEPAVVNDEALARTVARSLGSRRAEDRVDGDGHTPPGDATGLVLDTTFRSCGADDFSHYGEVLPSLMLFVGTAAAGTTPGSGPGLHHPEFSPDDAMVGEVARALLAAVTAAGAALVAPAAPADGAVETTAASAASTP
ncbi:M20 metallopeptidase family protein [Actinomycetospora straminea]|uniref:Amidohydrolase n=1 Tax=Actinomycetospora straminea TaxID=663607 RepID=A0ABP9EZ10_9PSEU|nr:amidohydrolase [Actinomycetospora straminea]MDD7931489.1 amidohydrolase [Actinomycetospora straminea]